MDLVLKNCRLADEVGEHFIKVDDGKITGISKTPLEAAESIDIEGNYVLPGFIDPHIHFRDPGLTQKEDFKTGSMAAANGGFATVIDMPNTLPKTNTYRALEEKIKIAKSKSVVNFELQVGHSDLDEMKKMMKLNPISVKVFMDLESDESLEKIFHDHEVIEKEFTGQAATETKHEYRKLAILIIGIVLFLFATRMYFSGQNADNAIEWNDAALEAKMREITGIYSGDIMYSDVKDITELDLSNPDGSSYDNDKIKDISALSSLKNLKSLNLGGNQISDISDLRNLTNLTKLKLYENQISDISAIGNLTNLTELRMGSNQISNISAIGSLTNLTCLALNENRIKDISALRNLTNLTYLWLYSNQINDISALSNLTNLTMLGISDNPINDYSPIEDLNIENLYKY